MQFKVSPVTLIKAFVDLQLEMKTGSGQVLDMPDYIELEGELLEGGGTVEKCCRDFFVSGIHTHRADCHNKKVDVHFNRETPKVCPSDHPMKDSKCAVTDGVRTCICKCSFCKKEVKLPEKLASEPFIDRHDDSRNIRKAFNQLREYLASRE